MENLPDELLINIFIRLLAKQLAQMRCVSKCWNALLSHPSFVKSHLHHSIHNNNQQILLVFPDYMARLTPYSSQSIHLEPTNFIKHNLIDLSKHNLTDQGMKVIGSVNGLICLSDVFYSNIHIWNPSLSKVSTIPPPHPIPATFYTDISHHISTFMRFGFDPKTDDYKLVRLSGIYSQSRVKEWLQVQVYGMRKRSWEFVTQPFPSHITRILDTDYLCVAGHDGYLHWQDMTDPRADRTIVAFDLGSETFNEIPLPDSIVDPNHIWHILGVLGEKVCELTLRKNGAWEVWAMEEYGVPESWVKRHVFSKFTTDAWRMSYGFTSRNELLLKDKDGRLLLYDPIGNKSKLTPTIQRAVKIVEYVDSLVWV